MEDIQLTNAISAYLQLLERIFKEGGTALSGQDRAGFRVLFGKKQLLLRLVEQAEASPEFAKLFEKTASTFSHVDLETMMSGIWKHHVEDFLRLSGLYQRIFEGEHVLPEIVLQDYQNAFQREQNTVRHLVPLEFVQFHGDDMTFGSFAIRRFSKSELDDIFRNEICEVFYEWAHIPVSKLEGYWFLYAEEKVQAKEPGKRTWLFRKNVELSQSQYPGPIEQALQSLALWDWGTFRFHEDRPVNLPRGYEPWEGPFRPNIPFVISVSDSAITRPARAPDLSALVRVPVYDSKTEEQIGEEPHQGKYFHVEETERFRSFLSGLVEIGSRLATHTSAWSFKDTALGFMAKAFMSPDGLEQLLWHITAIEAVLGQKVEGGLRQLLRARISRILGSTKQERKEIRKGFDELYGFRSDLVHGNADLSQREVYFSHLTEVRDFARGVVLWMLKFLSHIANNLPSTEAELPTRDELLAVLDMEPATRENVRQILNALPDDFPNARGWKGS